GRGRSARRPRSRRPRTRRLRSRSPRPRRGPPPPRRPAPPPGPPRLPPCCRASALPPARSLRGPPDLGRPRLLRGVRVLGPGVDLELADELTAQAVVREHALDGQLDGLLRALGQQLLVAGGAQATRVAGVPVGHLGLPLVAGQRHLARVD